MKRFILLVFFILSIHLLQGQVYDTVNVFQSDTALRCHVDTLILDAGEGFESFFWNTGETTRMIKVTANGTYDVTASSSGGQIEEASCYVNIIRASIMQESDTICYKDTLFLVVDDVSYHYQWNTAPEDTLFSLQVVLTNPSTYTVDIFDDINRCTDSIRLDMYPRINVEFEQNQENKGCPGGDCKGQVRIFVSGGTGDLSIDWDTPNVDPGDPTYAIGLCEGFVGVHIYDEIGCRFDTSYWVEVWDMPEIETTPDTTTYIQDPRLTFWFENLSADSISLINYFWALRNGTSSTLPNPTFSFGSLGEHIVRFEYTTTNGCVDSSLITITVRSVQLKVPNVFTPNGDGANDTFIITIKPPDDEDPSLKSVASTSNYQPINDFYISNELVVFNRSGRKVYEAVDYDNDWDGGSLPEGTYFYVLKCQGTQGEDVFRGAVTILR